jgi:hypothetical protein
MLGVIKPSAVTLSVIAPPKRVFHLENLNCCENAKFSRIFNFMRLDSSCKKKIKISIMPNNFEVVPDKKLFAVVNNYFM